MYLLVRWRALVSSERSFDWVDSILVGRLNACMTVCDSCHNALFRWNCLIVHPDELRIACTADRQCCREWFQKPPAWHHVVSTWTVDETAALTKCASFDARRPRTARDRKVPYQLHPL